jgi:hypothetical protein
MIVQFFLSGAALWDAISGSDFFGVFSKAIP